MLPKIYDIPIDIKDGKMNNEIIEIIAGDNGANVFNFKLFREKDVPYKLTGTTVNMLVKTPDGTRIKQDCIMVNAQNGELTLMLDTDLITQTGNHIAELQIYDSELLMIRLTTPIFNYNIRQSLGVI